MTTVLKGEHTAAPLLFDFARLQFLPNNHHSYHNRHSQSSDFCHQQHTMNMNFFIFVTLDTRALARSLSGYLVYIYIYISCLFVSLIQEKCSVLWSSTQQPASQPNRLAYRSNVSFIIILLSSVVRFVHTRTRCSCTTVCVCACFRRKVENTSVRKKNACLWNKYVRNVRRNVRLCILSRKSIN